MDSRKRWQQLSPGIRRLILVAGTAEGLVKIAALRDLKRRPSAEVRGSKLLWVAVVTVVNSFGIAPLVYLRFGRRR